MSIFHPTRSLHGYYENVERLEHVSSRRPVYKATLRGRDVALKEYPVGTGAPLKTCYTEAALLRRLRHPTIVELEAIFLHDGRLYLQMPFYANGTLNEWCKRARPSANALAAVLQQLCQAVAHVHANRIVHSDIKPENVLIDSTGRPRLADFDVSVDAITRRTLPTRAGGGSIGFLAPEIAQTGATEYSDLFALGKTIEHCVSNDRARPEALSSLISQLCTANPKHRPSAAAATNHRYFEELYAGRQEGEQQCMVCLEVHPLSRGVRCSDAREPHFICGGCLESHVHFCSVAELRDRKLRAGCVECPRRNTRECNAGPYSDSELARHLSDAAFDEYIKVREGSRTRTQSSPFGHCLCSRCCIPLVSGAA